MSIVRVEMPSPGRFNHLTLNPEACPKAIFDAFTPGGDGQELLWRAEEALDNDELELPELLPYVQPEVAVVLELDGGETVELLNTEILSKVPEPQESFFLQSDERFLYIHIWWASGQGAALGIWDSASRDWLLFEHDDDLSALGLMYVPSRQVFLGYNFYVDYCTSVEYLLFLREGSSTTVMLLTDTRRRRAAEVTEGLACTPLCAIPPEGAGMISASTFAWENTPGELLYDDTTSTLYIDHEGRRQAVVIDWEAVEAKLQA